MRDCALDTGCRGAVSECIPAETAATAIRHRVAAVRSTRAAALGRGFRWRRHDLANGRLSERPLKPKYVLKPR
jgi:hypothetical protein